MGRNKPSRILLFGVRFAAIKVSCECQKSYGITNRIRLHKRSWSETELPEVWILFKNPWWNFSGLYNITNKTWMEKCKKVHRIIQQHHFINDIDLFNLTIEQCWWVNNKQYHQNTGYIKSTFPFGPKNQIRLTSCRIESSCLVYKTVSSM